MLKKPPMKFGIDITKNKIVCAFKCRITYTQGCGKEGHLPRSCPPQFWECKVNDFQLVLCSPALSKSFLLPLPTISSIFSSVMNELMLRKAYTKLQVSIETVHISIAIYISLIRVSIKGESKLKAVL